MRAQLIGAAVAFAGMAVIGSARLAGASFGPFLLVILASFFWGSGNVLAKTVGRVDMLAFTVWSSLAAPLPLILLSLAVDGPGPLIGLAHPSLKLVLSVLVVAYAGTVFGFGVWARLLMHYSAATVAPFALLVPVVGMVAGSVVFGEPLRPVELIGARSGNGRPRPQCLRRLAAAPPHGRSQVIDARYQSDPRRSSGV